MFTIGLTGGIGSGKTTVSDIFSSLGIPVVDSDVLAREVVMPGDIGLKRIIERFGSDLLLTDGSLNRKKLRSIVFTDKSARHDLEQILHPLIRERAKSQIESLNTPYAIQSIPLLIETGQVDRFNRILVIDCPVELQIERICSRDGISRDQAMAILDSQISREKRLAAADDIIVNDKPLAELEDEVKDLNQKYLELASAK